VEKAARGDQGVTVLCLVDQMIGGACLGACPRIHTEVVSPERRCVLDDMSSNSIVLSLVMLGMGPFESCPLYDAERQVVKEASRRNQGVVRKSGRWRPVFASSLCRDRFKCKGKDWRLLLFLHLRQE
jgi:hypothetical protein